MDNAYKVVSKNSRNYGSRVWNEKVRGAKQKMRLDLSMFRMGDIICYRHEQTHKIKGFFGNNIIRKQLRVGLPRDFAQYSHVEICGGGLYKDNERIGVESINVAPPKARAIDITKTHKGRYITLLRYRGYDDKLNARYKVAYASARLNHLPYDIKGILGFVLNWVTQNQKFFFCSEHCTYAIRTEFPNEFPGFSNSKVMPGHFLMFAEQGRFTKIFEGRIE